MNDEKQSDDQVASQDEFDIALAEGIEDDALRDEASDNRNFSITSYGADYNVDSLVRRMNAEAFIIPEFQRRFVWSQTHASKFIESLLMGLPVPGIFLYKEAETNKHLVVDGQQRLRTLQAFYEGVFQEKRFRLTGVRDIWNGRTYSDLDPADQLKLDDSIVHATIFRQDEPKDVLDSIYFVFERINSGGIRLSPQEIRNCISAGPFIKLIKELNHNKHWRNVYGGPINKRSKDEELIVRFFAMLETRNSYSRPMLQFLNNYSFSKNKASDDDLRSLKDIFEVTISVIDLSLDGRAFRPARTLNAAVFDSVMVGLAERIKSRPDLPQPQDVSAVYDRLLQQSDFRSSWERATADEESVKSRMKAAIAAFQVI
ncbi:DUF262 domain-containing protein [Marinimicrococcus flavescens]|uniref:DUF262 domain-containing protein n=1 Tax=Marinimicrococcus flavescens TaxID=3031815 RepID=A0AAP3UY79_9PROT|nr:DUF262 domain-containing protein [Marinimicrococcus flavescens]